MHTRTCGVCMYACMRERERGGERERQTPFFVHTCACSNVVCVPPIQKRELWTTSPWYYFAVRVCVFCLTFSFYIFATTWTICNAVKSEHSPMWLPKVPGLHEQTHMDLKQGYECCNLRIILSSTCAVLDFQARDWNAYFRMLAKSPSLFLWRTHSVCKTNNCTLSSPRWRLSKAKV